ncbi:MAG: AarF/ABC1/UbiB kinase family protein [Acidimicrobiales bacterium]|nr:AarF/ABC1/UbiB kinase family protein [Acidimicrobiales bacterium]
MSRRTARHAAVVALVALAVGLTARWQRRRGSHDHTAIPVRTTSRAARNASVAALSARVGGVTAVTRARQVFASAERRVELNEELQLRTAADVARTLGEMKGALMKIGQMASYLDHGLPEPLRLALSQLQADAPPMSAGLAASVIEAELGDTPEALFAEWDPQPIAAASIGQVHRAITREGVAVAVKVQYPGVAEAIAADLGNADLLFGALGLAFPGLEVAPITEELRARITEELDYHHEAANQRTFVEFFRDHPFIRVPAVVDAYCSGRVLTTELATGATFDEVLTWDQETRDRIGETLFRFVFGSLYRLHAFNGDPHPGNYLFGRDGSITFLDFGLVRHFEQHEVDTFRRMVTEMVVNQDPVAFRRAVEDAGLLARDAPVSTEQVAEYFSHFYTFVSQRGPFAWNPDYASATVRQTFDASSPVTRHTTVPASFVLIQRINLGLYALLGQLASVADWRAVAENVWPWVDAPPTTELGRLEAAWRASHPG